MAGNMDYPEISGGITGKERMCGRKVCVSDHDIGVDTGMYLCFRERRFFRYGVSEYSRECMCFKDGKGTGCRRRYRAMMTMEAVIILPLTLMICLLIVWSGILLYNRTAADHALSVAVIQAARQAESENEVISSLAKDKAEELLNARMVMMEEASLDVKVGIDSVEAVYTGKMRAPVLPSFGDLKPFEWKVEVSRKSPRLKEAMTVRAMKNLGR